MDEENQRTFLPKQRPTLIFCKFILQNKPISTLYLPTSYLKCQSSTRQIVNIHYYNNYVWSIMIVIQVDFRPTSTVLAKSAHSILSTRIFITNQRSIRFNNNITA